MISLNPAKVNGVLLVFLYQSQTGHLECAQTIEKSILSLKQTLFPSHESMTALIILDMPSMLQSSICNNFSAIAEPLTNLLGKKAKYVWTDDCQKSFDQLKAILRSAPVLLAPSFDKEFKLAVDASDVGAGSVLLQEDDNGVDHPVCYFSKKFNKHQRNYSTIEKECLSLILALQHFEVYLASSHAPIVVFSDHNPLTFIHKMKNKNQRLLRWSLMLQEHNLDIRHIQGRDNIIPDTLSRA